MDNGVIEGKPMPFEECVRRAELINADEIVLPDVYRDNHGTYDAVKEAIDYYVQNNMFDNINLSISSETKWWCWYVIYEMFN